MIPCGHNLLGVSGSIHCYMWFIVAIEECTQFRWKKPILNSVHLVHQDDATWRNGGLAGQPVKFNNFQEQVMIWSFYFLHLSVWGLDKLFYLLFEDSGELIDSHAHILEILVQSVGVVQISLGIDLCSEIWCGLARDVDTTILNMFVSGAFWVIQK